MIGFLLIAVIVITIVLLGIVIFLWIQFNSTDSKLVRLIETRLRLDKVLTNIDEIEE